MRLRALKLPDVSLPSRKSTPLEDIGLYSILLYGGVKIGKTTLAAEFDDPFFLMFEPGGKALSIHQKPVESWPMFLAYLDALEKDRAKYQTIVLDTVDIAFTLCERWVCEKLAIQHPSDMEWGKGWGAVRDEFFDGMRRTVMSGRGSVFISHEQIREVRRRGNSEPEHVVQTALTGQGRNVLEPLVDIWVYYGRDNKSNRELQVVGDTFVSAGHRLKNNFRGPKAVPIVHIAAGGSARQSYLNFMAAFGSTATDEEIERYYPGTVFPSPELAKGGPKKVRVARRKSK